ncbi:MAG: cell wall metabolism sensor histidine kinase WalK [Oscillospiraceae bacterium]|nr:cell wall metabolism sensor histidine kinase WalK [Oscillospiraceae bacterium]
MLYKSLHFKLVLMLVLFILIIISVIVTVMLNGVFDLYSENFNGMMSDTLDDNLIRELEALMDGGDFYIDLRARLWTEHGNLGINNYRNLYILDMMGGLLAGTNDELGRSLIKTPNMLAAMNKKTGGRQSFVSEYMDYAVYISSVSGERECIIYIKDTREETRVFSWAIFEIIIQVLLVGLVVAVILSFFLAKSIAAPIQSITKGAVKLADGSFNRRIEVVSNDEIGTLIVTFNDMAEKLKAARDQSDALEKSRREFIANVSHELRTPLTSIIGAAETIYESRIDEEAKLKFLNMILSEGGRMTRIVQDLLIISRLDNRKMMWEFTFVNISVMAKNIYETSRGEADKKDQTLSLNISGAIGEIYADKIRIEQVLVNIISNAIKYTQNGGEIDFLLEKCEIREEGRNIPGVKFTVRDNGFGIPEEDLPRIFERFYRVEKARSSEAGGTGLGLSIAKEIVTAHRGNITVDSEQGKGTCVTVILPKNPQNADGENENPEV